nr:MAG TPA: hypothetical protein [Caudoviricetes sp.]
MFERRVAGGLKELTLVSAGFLSQFLPPIELIY